ncbi:MAG: 50S ribosomal protein L23, partial [Burkholderiales bacterium]
MKPATSGQRKIVAGRPARRAARQPLHATSVIKYPVSSEKAIRLMEAENKLVFVVDIRAGKPEIKKA